MAATAEAGLAPNTTYAVTVYVECDGSATDPVYYSYPDGSLFLLSAPGGQINFTVTTDDNGCFTQEWSNMYMNCSAGLSYVYYTGIEIR